jgi:3-oxoacyl-[acyl-carrier-protein] synthase II
MREQVVVTGMGVLTPIGSGAAAFAQGLREGRDGVAPIQGFEAGRHRVRVAAELRGFAPERLLSEEERALSSRATQMTRVAAAEALLSAGLDLEREDRARIGVILGTDLGGMPAASTGYEALHHPYRRRGPAGLRAWKTLLLDSFICSVADQLALHHQLYGTTLVVSTACSAGIHALGIGADAIRRGDAEVMLVGGVDPLSEMPQAGFGVLRSLASDGIRPFDRERDGTVLGEAAAVLVLESASHARRRGARVRAEVAGYGSSTDAYHMTRPDDTGRGPARAMAMALADAGVAPEEIGYVKAHGTATPANDVIETRALKLVFGAGTQVPVSSVKSMIGHSLGASGAVEAVAAILALEGQFLPPTLHLEHPDPECDLDYVPCASRAHAFESVLANAFGFGGNNASMVFLRADARESRPCA